MIKKYNIEHHHPYSDDWGIVDEVAIESKDGKWVPAEVAEDLYEENEQRSRLIGEVFVLLQQARYSEALDAIYNEEVIDFSSDSPVAVSNALARARGEA